MKTKTKTLKGWANNSDLFFSQNTTNESFLTRFKDLKKDLEQKGYKELNTSFATLKNKSASEKIIVKAWYWLGSWNDPKVKQYAVFYK
jgi:hypothetical protein